MEICTIDLSEFGLDNYYTFYYDKRIKRIYDRNYYKRDIEEWITSNEISNNVKEKLITLSNNSFKKQLENILYEL